MVPKLNKRYFLNFPSLVQLMKRYFNSEPVCVCEHNLLDWEIRPSLIATNMVLQTC